MHGSRAHTFLGVQKALQLASMVPGPGVLGCVRVGQQRDLLLAVLERGQQPAGGQRQPSVGRIASGGQQAQSRWEVAGILVPYRLC